MLPSASVQGILIKQAGEALKTGGKFYGFRHFLSFENYFKGRKDSFGTEQRFSNSYRASFPSEKYDE